MRTNRIARFAIVLLPFSMWSALREGKRFAKKLQSAGNRHVVKPSYSYDLPDRRKRNDDDKPLFILHIGPPKTGTTFLQYYAGDNQEILQRDNIHYLGQYKPRKDMRIHDLCFSCLMERERDCIDKWKELELKVDYHFQQKHTVLMSEENFILQDLEGDSSEHLWDYLEPILAKWNVRIVLTYRKYHEWLPSYYMQFHNPNGERGRKKKRFLLWPEGKRRMIPTFRAFFQQHLDSNVSLAKEIRLWKSKFPDDVRVLNMHSETQTVQQIFCDAIPEAKQLCKQASRKQRFGTKNSSARKYVHFDRIAMAAYQEGLIQDGLNRTHVKKAVEEHSRGLGLTKVTDFPLICLNKNQSETFRKMSLEYESELLPELHTELNADFAQAKERGAFCSVDVHSVTKDKKWQAFFKSLTA